MQKFSKKEAIKFGWRTMKDNLGFYIGALVIIILTAFVPNTISQTIMKIYPKNVLILLVGFIIAVAVFIMQRALEMGFLKINLRVHDNEKVSFADLFSCFPLFFKYVGAMVLYLLIVACGLILLVVPGIIWAIRFSFYSYFIVDKGLGPIKALKESWGITKGSAWNVFLLDLLNGGIIILGVLCVIVGLFAAIPVVSLASVYVYRKLELKTEPVDIMK